MRRALPVWILGGLLAALLPFATVASVGAAEPDPYEGVRLKVKGLRRLLKRASSKNAAILQVMGEVEREYRALPAEADVADDDARKAVDRLKDEIERLWLRAFTVFKVPARMDINTRTPVQIRAAQAVARSRPCIDKRYRIAVERVLDNDRYVCAPAFYNAAFTALVALDQPRLVDWFLDHALQARVDPDHKQRALASLDALMSMRRVSGRERREVVRKIVAIFQSYAFHWRNEYDAIAGFRTVDDRYKKVAGVATPYWMDLRPTLIDALRTFSTDPRTGLPPFDKRSGREIEALPRFLNWLASNQRVGQPPWIDLKDDQQPSVRARAVGRYVRPSIPLLFHHFGIPWESWWAIAHDPLRPRTGDSSDAVDSSASDAFRASLRKRLATSLLDYVDDDDATVRAAATMALALIEVPDATKRLVAIVESGEMPIVREAAMLGLMLLRPTDRLGWLRGRVLDKDEAPRVRGYATLALGWLQAAPFLWELVREDERRGLGGESAFADIRSCAVFALGIAGAPDAAAPLCDLLKKPGECPAVLSAVGPAVARLEQTNVIPVLLRVLHDRRKVATRHVAQISAAQALGALVPPTDKSCIRKMRQRLERSSEQFGGVRSQLALSLGRIGGTHAIEALETEYERCLKSTIRYAERGFFLLGYALTGASAGRHRVRTQLIELTHDKDLGAAAAAVTLADDRAGIARVTGRINATGPNYTPYAIQAAGRLSSVAAAKDVRRTLSRRHDPRVMRASALALARLLGSDALVDVQRIWERSHASQSFDALAWAFHHMPSGEAEGWLHSVVRDEGRRPNGRAYALLALARMAGGEALLRSREFAKMFNPYGEAPTLTGLAKRGDAAFLD